MDYLDKIITRSIGVIRNVCAVLLVLMTVIISLHVLFRYMLSSPLIWSEEIALLLLIWFGFFSISNELYDDNHMAIVMFYEKFPAKLRKIIDVIRHFIVGAFCLIMIIYLSKITMSIGGNKLPVSRLPKIIMYIPVIISSILMLFYSAVLFVKTLRDNFFVNEGEK